MKAEHLEELRKVDQKCFERAEKKTRERIEELFYLSHGGAFIGIDNGKIEAYIFTHPYGEVAFIGPIGVLQEERNQGCGSLLLTYAINYLIEYGIKEIYIEVLQNKTQNIGFYLKNGFIFDRPTIQLQYVVNKMDDTLVIKLGNSLDAQDIKSYLKEMAFKCNGFSYENDLLRIVERDPSSIAFCINEQGHFMGFLGYYQQMYDFVFGYLDADVSMKKNFDSLYRALCKRFNREYIPIRINTENYWMYTSIIKKSRVEKILERMHYDNSQNLKMNNSIIRSYIG